MKLYYQNRKSATAALLSYTYRKYIRIGKGSHTSSALKRMFSKFEDTGCSDDRSRENKYSEEVLMLLGQFRKKWRL